MARARHEQTPERAQAPRQDQSTAPAAAARRSTQAPSAPVAEQRCGAPAPRSPSARVLHPLLDESACPRPLSPAYSQSPAQLTVKCSRAPEKTPGWVQNSITNRPTDGKQRREIKNTVVKQLPRGSARATPLPNLLMAQRRTKLPNHLHSPSCLLTDDTGIQDNFSYIRS